MSRILLASDVHANVVALEAVLAAAGPVDGIWVMGDTVGYGPDPADALALLREQGATLVAGNHDLAVGSGEGLAEFNAHAAAAARIHRGWLSAADRDHLASLPLVLPVETFTLCHGSLRDPVWEYVFTEWQARATIELATTPHVCNGHTHVPRIFRSGDRMLVNPGSVGQPRDGDPRASYAILDTATGTVTLERAGYDVAETQRRIRARGLPEILADRLSRGY